MTRARAFGRLVRWVPVLAIAVLLVAALALAADAEGFVGQRARWYPYVFAAAALALAALAIFVIARLWRLQRRIDRGEPGARLARRFSLILAVLVIPPVVLVYAFALRFVSATVDSWLVAHPVAALDAAVVLADDALGKQRASALASIADLAAVLEAPGAIPVDALEGALDTVAAEQFALFAVDGRVVAVASASASVPFPQPPADAERLVAASREAGSVGQDADGTLVAVRILPATSAVPKAALVGRFRLPADILAATGKIEAERAALKRAEFLRSSLKFAFSLILSFVVLLSVFMAVLLAIELARRLAAPIGALAKAAQQVAAGDLEVRVAETSHDEIGFLARAFNTMTAELGVARDRLEAGRIELEAQREFLASVLERQSSGVLVIAADGAVRQLNPAGRAILEASASGVDHRLNAETHQGEAFDVLRAAVLKQLATGAREWRAELPLARSGEQRKLLLVRGVVNADGEAVVVFDDTSDIDLARREAAWSEVARRFAHEVRNPLTPIRLAADRMQRKLLPQLDAESADALNRATRTIADQVDALRALCDGFGEYAAPARLHTTPTSLGSLVDSVIDLYAGHGRARLTRRGPDLSLPADPGRLRQLLHNLITNAVEAGSTSPTINIAVDIAATHDARGDGVALQVIDDGRGLPTGFDERWFEPYQTTKTKGHGLGLAIARRIAEEHGGALSARNAEDGGAIFECWLPMR